MNDKSLEWLRQAEYEMENAEAMLATRRYLAAVFHSHLSVEKALKGICHQSGSVPPKTHDLLYLLELSGLHPPQHVPVVLAVLNEAQLRSRYPDDIEATKAFTLRSGPEN